MGLVLVRWPKGPPLLPRETGFCPRQCQGLVVRIHWGFVSAAGVLLQFHQQGAVCAFHQEAAGPRPAHQVSLNQAPQTDVSARNLQVSWCETSPPSFLGSPPAAGVWKEGKAVGGLGQLGMGKDCTALFSRCLYLGGARPGRAERLADTGVWP